MAAQGRMRARRAWASGVVQDGEPSQDFMTGGLRVFHRVEMAAFDPAEVAVDELLRSSDANGLDFARLCASDESGRALNGAATQVSGQGMRHGPVDLRFYLTIKTQVACLSAG